MPRTGRGGKVKGADGKAYANRSDLNVSKTLPIETAPNQTYGKATEQRTAQRAIPLQTPNASVPPVTNDTQSPMKPNFTLPPGCQAAAQPTPTVPTIDQMGSGPEAMRQNLSTEQPVMGGVVASDPDHVRLAALAREMADGPYSTSAMRDLADFMETMIF